MQLLKKSLFEAVKNDQAENLALYAALVYRAGSPFLHKKVDFDRFKMRYQLTYVSALFLEILIGMSIVLFWQGGSILKS